MTAQGMVCLIGSIAALGRHLHEIPAPHQRLHGAASAAEHRAPVTRSQRALDRCSLHRSEAGVSEELLEQRFQNGLPKGTEVPKTVLIAYIMDRRPGPS